MIQESAIVIDYEKLKFAHELAEKHQKQHEKEISIELNFVHELVEYILHYGSESDAFSCIDVLIEKLTELTQPEPKYKVGDILWYIHNNNPIEVIVAIDISNGERRFCARFLDESCLVDLDECYPSKQSLIEAQLDYWQEQLSEELEQHISPYCEPIKECTHESCPEYKNAPFKQEYPLDNKCIKCGEFYK